MLFSEHTEIYNSRKCHRYTRIINLYIIIMTLILNYNLVIPRSSVPETTLQLINILFSIQ